jgi:hypothetical protein
MELSVEEMESIIGEILLAGKLSKVKNKKGEDILLYFSQPRRKDIMLSEYYHKEALEKATSEGLPSIEDMDKLLIRRGFWGPKKESEIKYLEEQIKAQKVILSKTTKVLSRRENIEQVIKDLEVKVKNIRLEREQWLEHTIERKAEDERMLVLSWAGIQRPLTNERYWDTLEDFRNETDFVFRNEAALKYTISALGFPSKTIRYLARSSPWVVRFSIAQKNIGKLFDRDVYDFSIDQINISYWSSFYLSLNEMMPEDKPSEDVIEDDEALDLFMENYFKDRKEEEREARAKKKSGSKNKSAFDHSEVLVMKSNPIYSDVAYSDLPNQKQKQKGEVDVVEKNRK